MANVPVFKQELAIAGLKAQVYSTSPVKGSCKAVAAMFLLHGRGSSAAQIAHTVESIARLTHADGCGRDLLIVTFVRFRNSRGRSHSHDPNAIRISETMELDRYCLHDSVAF